MPHVPWAEIDGRDPDNARLYACYTLADGGLCCVSCAVAGRCPPSERSGMYRRDDKPGRAPCAICGGRINFGPLKIQWSAAILAELAIAEKWPIDNWQAKSCDYAPPRDPEVERKEPEIGGFWYRVGCPDGTWRVPPPDYDAVAKMIYQNARR